ncbi:MAG: glutaredoxin family protein [Spirochaetes bacterium]|nr:glutaredoxin family protein [Spirochaetota bacterium]
MTLQHVEGRAQGKIVIYALSTCMWCRMTKSLLSQIGVAYSYVDVDTLEGGDKDQAKAEIKRWNPAGSYPTIVIDDREVISGYDEAEIRGRLE